jgi:flagellar hook-length control protein FliK
MLPLISSLATEFTGLSDDSTVNLPRADGSGSPFAGVLNQSVAAKPLAKQGVPAGQALPADGKLLPLDLPVTDLPVLEVDLSIAGFFGQDIQADVSAEPGSGFYRLGLAPGLDSDALANELSDFSRSQSEQGGLTIEALADLKPTQTDKLEQDLLVDPLDTSAPIIGPPLGLVTEQRLIERQGSLGFIDNAAVGSTNATDSKLPIADLLLRGTGTEQRPATPAVVFEQPVLTRSTLSEMPAMAIQASSAAAELLDGATGRLTGQAAEGPASIATTSILGNASMPGLAAVSPASAVPVSTPALHIGVPVQDSAWSTALGDRVLVMTGQQLQSAEIRISPAELGPITVNLSVDDGSADLTFHAHHALTREAIEQALPRLRDMLNENGLTLGNATVSDQGVQKDGFGHASGDGSDGHSINGETSGLREAEEVVQQRIAQGLLDTFV